MTSGSLPYRGAAPRLSLNRLPGVRPGSDPGLTPVDRGYRGAFPAWFAAAWLLSSAAGAAAADLAPPAAGPDAKMAPAQSAATQSGTAFTKEAPKLLKQPTTKGQDGSVVPSTEGKTQKPRTPPPVPPAKERPVVQTSVRPLVPDARPTYTDPMPPAAAK